MGTFYISITSPPSNYYTTPLSLFNEFSRHRFPSCAFAMRLETFTLKQPIHLGWYALDVSCLLKGIPGRVSGVLLWS